MKYDRKQLGKILIEKGLINAEQLNSALKEQEHSGEFLGKILQKKGIISEKNLMGVLCEQFDIPCVSLRDIYVDWALVKQFSPSLILDHQCFPYKKDDWSVTFAVVNPLDLRAISKAEEESGGLKLKLALASESDMLEIAERYRQYMRGSISKLFE